MWNLLQCSNISFYIYSQEVEEQKGELVIIDETSDVAGDEVFIEYVEEISEEAEFQDTTDEMKVAGNDTSITEEQQSLFIVLNNYSKMF